MVNLTTAMGELNADKKDIVFTIFDTLLYDDLLSEVIISWETDDGEEINVARLSEGQKQIVLTQGINLIFGKEEKNLLFLFDEPDVFLHPKWQQKFVANIYEGLDATSMVIITSHSPNIVSNLSENNLQLLRNGRVVTKAVRYYGKTVESILGDYFGLKSTRSIKIAERIAGLWKKIQENKYDEEAFNEELKEMETIIGPDDEEIMAMNRDILRKKYEKNK